MIATVQKWGNSLALRIPSALAKDVDLRQGSVVEVAAVKGEIIVTPKKERRLSLTQMLRAVTKGNRHSEADWGQAVGREIR